VVARDALGKYSEILFSNVIYVDVPVFVEEACLRRASSHETDDLIRSVPAPLGSRISRHLHFTIASAGANYSICASRASLRHLPETEALWVGDMLAPLWTGGPVPCELFKSRASSNGR
jgi:hypothetical protein